MIFSTTCILHYCWQCVQLKEQLNVKTRYSKKQRSNWNVADHNYNVKWYSKDNLPLHRTISCSHFGWNWCIPRRYKIKTEDIYNICGWNSATYGTFKKFLSLKAWEEDTEISPENPSSVLLFSYCYLYLLG